MNAAQLSQKKDYPNFPEFERFGIDLNLTVKPIFINKLCVTYLGSDRWKLLNELWFHSIIVSSTIKVPVGFVTDFASVPRVPGLYWWFGGMANRPATIHDYLYETHHYSRKIADKIFLEALEVDGYNVITRCMMYRAVRWFGRRAYNRHKEV